jgi:hypothetical protein
VQSVEERNQQRGCQYDQQNVTKQEVTTPKGHLDNFNDEFAGRLRHGRAAEAPSVPFTSPPCTVRLVVFELTRQENGNKNLLDSTLHGDNGDDSQYCMRSIPEFEKPL